VLRLLRQVPHCFQLFPSIHGKSARHDARHGTQITCGEAYLFKEWDLPRPVAGAEWQLDKLSMWLMSYCAIPDEDGVLEAAQSLLACEREPKGAVSAVAQPAFGRLHRCYVRI
jgi:hypothetical protein